MTCSDYFCVRMCHRFLVNRVWAAQKDSLGLKVYFFNLGGGQTVRGTLVQDADGKATLSIGEVNFDLVMSPDGRLLSAAIPAQGLKVQRVQ